MRHFLLMWGLVVGLIVPGSGASSAPLQYTLTFNKPVQIIGPGGTARILRVTGAIGGVVVVGEYTDKAWRVGAKVDPEGTFADGNVSCSGTRCTFSITTLLDQPASVQSSSFTLGSPVTGPLPGFATRRAWVSAVAHWADTNVDPGLKDKIVSQAAGVQAGDGQ